MYFIYFDFISFIRNGALGTQAKHLSNLEKYIQRE